MKLAGLRLRRRDSTTCGPSVGANKAWFDDEQLRVHAEVNRIWPRMLGTTHMIAPDGPPGNCHNFGE